MMTKKLFPFAIFSLVLIAAIYLLIQLNRAYEEFSHWKSKEAVLEKELEDLWFLRKYVDVLIYRLQNIIPIVFKFYSVSNEANFKEFVLRV